MSDLRRSLISKQDIDNKWVLYQLYHDRWLPFTDRKVKPIQLTTSGNMLAINIKTKIAALSNSGVYYPMLPNQTVGDTRYSYINLDRITEDGEYETYKGEKLTVSGVKFSMCAVAPGEIAPNVSSPVRFATCRDKRNLLYYGDGLKHSKFFVGNIKSIYATGVGDTTLDINYRYVSGFVLLENGSLWQCCRDIYSGEYIFSFIQVKPELTFSRIFGCDGDVTLALDVDGYLWGCGDLDCLACGRDTEANEKSDHFIKVSPIKWTNVWLSKPFWGGPHIYAEDINGEIYAWGNNQGSVLHVGSAAETVVNVTSTGLSNIKKIAGVYGWEGGNDAGKGYTLVLTKEDKLLCAVNGGFFEPLFDYDVSDFEFTPDLDCVMLGNSETCISVCLKDDAPIQLV